MASSHNDHGLPPKSYSEVSKNPEPVAMMPPPYVYTTQPGVSSQQTGMWISPPPPIEDVPPGLEYLTLVDTVVVQQIVETIEVLIGFETKNKYSLKNANGQQVYFAAEESSCPMRNCCGGSRSFTIHIVDNFQREVIRINRPFKCFGNCCCICTPGCAEECTVESPPGQPIGKVVQLFACCTYAFSVRDTSGSEIFKIEGPNCCRLDCSCCADKKFKILSKSRELEVGVIKKKWGGCLKESFTDADTFVVNFPIDLDVRVKALLLGATFLIDFMAFEDSGNSG